MLKKAASGVPCLRRSGYAQAGRHCAVLTYLLYAPRVKMAAAFPSSGSGQDWTDFFEHSLSLMLDVCSGASMGYRHEIFNRPFHPELAHPKNFIPDSPGVGGAYRSQQGIEAFTVH